MLHIERAVVPDHVNFNYVGLLPRFQFVYIVPEKQHLFGAWDAAWLDLGGRLLENYFLVIAVNGTITLLQVGTVGLAGTTRPESDLFVGDQVGTFELSTSVALVGYLFQLIKHFSSRSHHPLYYIYKHIPLTSLPIC